MSVSSSGTAGRSHICVLDIRRAKRCCYEWPNGCCCCSSYSSGRCCCPSKLLLSHQDIGSWMSNFERVASVWAWCHRHPWRSVGRAPFCGVETTEKPMSVAAVSEPTSLVLWGAGGQSLFLLCWPDSYIHKAQHSATSARAVVSVITGSMPCSWLPTTKLIFFVVSASMPSHDPHVHAYYVLIRSLNNNDWVTVNDTTAALTKY